MKHSFAKRFLPLLALFLAPILLTLILVLCLPTVYENTFLGELGEKYDRLTEDDSKKIVVVAGSSAAFGLDSELLENATGYKTVNFGLYANLGTKLMMDLSRANICEGDIYILAPEMNSQTLSLYFNGETAIQAIDGNLSMLRYIESEDREALLGSMWGHLSNKLNYFISGTAPENTGAYRKENFNVYGDNTYSRPYKEISGYGNKISFDFGHGYDEFTDYVNDYVEYVRSRGGEVYFSFPPMNRDAVYAASTDEDITDFYTDLCERLDCKVISNIYDYILDGGYFFDSEFHLNDSGVVIRTVQLADDIKRELGNKTVTMALSSLPKPTGDKPDTDELILIKLSNGWSLEGLTDKGKSQPALIIPDEVSGLPITQINSVAFEGANAKLIQLSSNINKVAGDAFYGVANLEAVVIPKGISCTVMPLVGSDFTYYVDADDIDGYTEHFDFAVEETELFTSVAYTEGEETYREITGLTDLGRLYPHLTIPEKIRGRAVGAISENAFVGSETASITTSVALENLPLATLLSEGITVNLGYEDYNKALADPAFAEYMAILKTDNLYYNLAENDDGSLIITGLNEAGKTRTELTLPEKISGRSVKTVAEGAFKDSQVVTIYVSDSISRLDGRAFADSHIREVIMPKGVSPDKISVPNNMSESKATDGALESIAIYVPDELYEAYAADYFWGDYGSMLKKLSER